MILKGPEVVARSVAGSKQGVLVLMVKLGQGGNQTPRITANAAALFKCRGVINSNLQI